MIQSEHILEYIDGQLDPESEQDLFDAMARQPELRSVLRQFVSIGDAVRADREAYTPPADLERSLMAGLGISAADLGFASASTGLLARLGAMMSGKLWSMIDAFVLGVVATGLLFLAADSGREGAPRDGGLVAQSTAGRAATGDRGNAPAAPGAATAPGTDRGGTPQATMPAMTTPPNALGGARSQMPLADAPASGSTASGTNASGTTTTANEALHPAPVRNSVRSNTAAPVLRTRDVTRARRPAASVPDRTDRADASHPARNNNASDLGTGHASSDQPTVTDINATHPDRTIGSTSERDATRERSTSTRETQAISMNDDVVPQQSNVDVVRLRTAPAVTPSSSVRNALEEMPDAARYNSNATSPLDAVVSEAPESGGRVMIIGRALSGWSLNSSNARTAAGAGRTAFAAGGFWRMSDGLSVGLEGGQESYDQTLRYRHGDTLQIDQRPNFLWGGASLRYEMARFTVLSFTPYMQATLGATSIGPLFRYQLGAQFDVSKALGVTVGGELSSLLYEFDQQRLMSGRFGVSAGVVYTFR